MMNRVVYLVLATAAACFLLSSSVEAGPPYPDWRSIKSDGCEDINGDGVVDLSNEILQVILHYQKNWGNEDYALIYDQNGDGVIDLSNDILQTILGYAPGGDPDCTFIDKQILLGATAALDYRDPQEAFNDGYEQVSQYVPLVGIQLINEAYIQQYRTFYDSGGTSGQLRHPAGLLYSETSPGSGVPDMLVGTTYVMPNDEVCGFYSMQTPCESATVQPVGFGSSNVDDDNQIWGFQQGWHRLWGLCLKDSGSGSAEQWVLGPGAEDACTTSPYNGDQWVNVFGWRLNVYNFVPNPEGRFMFLNVNQDFP